MPCITYMWNLKYSTNEPMYKTETDSQTERIDLWVTRRGTGWKEKDGLGVWIGRCKLSYLGCINKVPNV